MNKLIYSLAVIAGLTAAMAQAEKPTARSGNPADHLPAGTTQLTWFGERPQFSPDGKRVAFMEKSFGDAFEMELATRRIKLLTHFPHPGFVRVHYLPNGDYLLVGARTFENVQKTRYSDQELWVLKAGAREPVALYQKVTEGVAVSRRGSKVAWAIDTRTSPTEVPARTALIYTGDIVDQGGNPVLTNKREAVRLDASDCVGTEPQDFRNGDRELIFVCYTYNTALKAIDGEIRGVDLATGKVTSYLKVADQYDEPEGISPDGRHILVESSRGLATATSKTIDIWKLRLGSNGQDMVRLTRFGDYAGYKASNPVVSPDGRTIAFQMGRSVDEAGVGHGIFLRREPR